MFGANGLAKRSSLKISRRKRTPEIDKGLWKDDYNTPRILMKNKSDWSADVKQNEYHKIYIFIYLIPASGWLHYAIKTQNKLETYDYPPCLIHNLWLNEWQWNEKEICKKKPPQYSTPPLGTYWAQIEQRSNNWSNNYPFTSCDLETFCGFLRRYQCWSAMNKTQHESAKHELWLWSSLPESPIHSPDLPGLQGCTIWPSLTSSMLWPLCAQRDIIMLYTCANTLSDPSLCWCKVHRDISPDVDLESYMRVRGTPNTLQKDMTVLKVTTNLPISLSPLCFPGQRYWVCRVSVSWSSSEHYR